MDIMNKVKSLQAEVCLTAFPPDPLVTAQDLLFNSGNGHRELDPDASLCSSAAVTQ